MTVAEVGERALIERIRVRILPAPGFVVVGLGDDAAVIEPERNALEVISTDSQVEGVHFDPAFVGPGEIGHKALAVNLSDLAAMGAAPRVALLSLVLPPAWPVAHFDALVDGLLALAASARISLVGGNIARSTGPLVVDVTVTGSVHRRRVLTRAGARAGDELYVTGSLGGAAAGLRQLKAGHPNAAAAFGSHERLPLVGPAFESHERLPLVGPALGTPAAGLAADLPVGAFGGGGSGSRCAQRYLRPQPRLKFGLLLSRNRAARACIDLSDGLADGVRQIGEASALGAVIEADKVPVESGATLHDALAGGEDYELLFALSPKVRSRLNSVRRLVKDLAVTRIGRLTTDRALLLERNGRMEDLPAGFEHFSAGPTRLRRSGPGGQEGPARRTE